MNQTRLNADNLVANLVALLLMAYQSVAPCFQEYQLQGQSQMSAVLILQAYLQRQHLVRLVAATELAPG